jgi:ATP-dependent helicase/nuclease subunit B
MADRPTIYSIPPGVPFVDALAQGLLDRHADNPMALSATTLLLPTRRACRALTEAFLRRSDGAALLLPRMLPIGETEEIDPLLSAEDEPGGRDALDLPPAIPDLQRRLALSRLILEQARKQDDGDLSPARAARLAGSLADLLDQVQTERVSFDGLADLVPDEYAAHWQITLEFLVVLTEHWPGVVNALGCLDPAARRNALIEGQATAWRQSPPEAPVIAAGSTGSVPATAGLLEVVAGLPRGAVVLPGLDPDMTEAEEGALEATHPQYGMRRLLARMGVTPSIVETWETTIPPACSSARVRLIRTALQPPVEGAVIPEMDTGKALEGVQFVACAGPQEEAGVIALALRRALETPGRTAALITPDRALARRVAVELGRWDIEIDDSAGTPLTDTPVGTFLRLAADCLIGGLTPISLLALLKHPLAAGGLEVGTFRAHVRRLERLVLRGPRPAAGFEGLRAALDGIADVTELATWLSSLEEIARPTIDLVTRSRSTTVEEIVAAHIAFVEALATSADETGPARLWEGDDGEAAANFIAELLESVAVFPPIAGADYPAFMETLMAGRAVRPRYGVHPRLHIWGLLEARLQHADLVCLGGLNEGTWPMETAADPWMSRPMRAAFGLPPPERRVGLSAHDFVQAFCAQDVLITRGLRVDGTPTVPARWLLRIANVIPETQGDASKLDVILRPAGEEWLGWQMALDEPDSIQPVMPPAPTPPLAARPRHLSVTQVETWMRDPYSIYARHVLKLRALDAIDADPGAAERGTMIHAALDAFVRDYPDALPADSLAELITRGTNAFGDALARPGVWAFWWPRFRRVAEWFMEAERIYRIDIAKTHTEVEGSLTIEAPGGPFTLVAKADRVDRLVDGTLSIIDYKTGGIPTAKDIALGFSPQLPLEAAIAAGGGFRGVPAGVVSRLEFWRLSGNDPAGERSPAAREIEPVVATARAGLAALVARFDDPETAYLSQPDPARASPWSDYDHLARVQEWSSVDGAGD